MKQILIYMAMAVSTAAYAQRGTLSLDDCLRQAKEQNLLIKSGRLAVERATDLQGTSFDLEPTSLTLGQDPTSGGSPDNALTIGQTFSMPAVYSRKRKQLKAETEVERRQLDMTEAEVCQKVTQAYWRLVYESERRKLLLHLDSIYQGFYRIASAKTSAGETGRLESLNTAKLRRENELALKNVENDYRMAQLQLMRWMNTDEAVSPSDTVLSPMVASFTASYDSAISLQGRYADSKVKVAEATLQSVKGEALPTVSLAASTQLVIKGFNPYDVDRSAYDKGNFMGFEVGINIPLAFGTQRGKVRAAKKMVEMARVEREAQLQAVASIYHVKMMEYENAKAQLDYYEKEAIDQAHEQDRISQMSYEQGSIDYMELMQNMRSVVEVYMARAQAVYDYNKVVAELNYLMAR